LQSAKDYAALSYTWGTAAPSIPIVLHGKVALVSENLYLALLHLRKRSVTLIWVDALCINQEDLAERARQVSHMEEVYRRASLVWVWLGDSDKFSEVAFEELHGLREHLNCDGAVLREHLVRELHQHPQRWRAISELLYRPWFRRMWIIQEVLSGRRAMMICGKDVIDVDLFLKLIYSLFKAEILKSVMAFHPSRHELSGGPLRVAFEQLSFLVRAKIETTDFLASTSFKFKRTLLNFMVETRWAEATNPLDKIYGIFSLASDASSLGYWNSGEEETSLWRPFDIDYTLTKEALFINVTKAIICTSRSLEILRFAKYEPNSKSNLPSWVADWAHPTPHAVRDYLPLEPIKGNGTRSWRPLPGVSKASKELDPSIFHEITNRCGAYFKLGHENTLIIKGIHVDTIATLSSHTVPDDLGLFFPGPQQFVNAAEDLAKWHHYLESLKIWSEECVRHAQTCTPSPTEQSISSAFWTVLNGRDARTEDQVPDGCLALPRAIEKLQVALCNFGKQICSKVDAPVDMAGFAAQSNLEHCMSRLPDMTETCFAQKFATTQKRYMGIMPDGAKVGDLICAMYGCETPVVLRSCEGGCFGLIGHGKVHMFDFDDAVVESTFSFRSGARKSKKEYTFTTPDETGRNVYTLLKETREFTLV
jgi:hypothetical protein